MPLLLRNISKKRAKLVNLNEIARKELAEVLDRQVKPLLVKSHNLVVADWQHRPKFQTRKEIRAARISITVFPVGDNADIFKFVDQGTKAHMIPASGGRIYPVKAKALAFAYGGKYQAKTLAKPARTVGSGGGVIGGTPIVVSSVKGHMVSGIEKREFSKTIAGDIEPDFNRIVDSTFKRIAKMVEE